MLGIRIRRVACFWASWIRILWTEVWIRIRSVYVCGSKSGYGSFPFLIRCWADGNNAYKIKFWQKLVFASLKSLKKEVWSRVGSGSEVRGTDPRIRIRTKMSWIPKTDSNIFLYLTHRKKEDTYQNMRNLSGLKKVSIKRFQQPFTWIAPLILSLLYNTKTLQCIEGKRIDILQIKVSTREVEWKTACHAYLTDDGSLSTNETVQQLELTAWGWDDTRLCYWSI